ncbi:hypothetical protein LTR08_008534 [Meristemomyces frigidus]|nr:hypothetical protein LTR08_008534 [Meristemomyces frigidus]
MTALSIKAFARGAPEETALKDVLGRVNLERGHFRHITEASLQAEVAGDGVLELTESEDEDEDDEKDDAEQVRGKPETREELFKAKVEMLQHVGAAEQDILMALDFISLLMSKDAPGSANATVSPALRQVVPLGTLGTDMWERMPVDRARQAQDELLATNVRMESLQQNADSLLAAASRLQANVRKETQYWNEILSISEKGWNVCRLPGQRYRLGVTFGFSESSPEFSRRGIAALNVGSDGTVALERGVGMRPKALRVLLKQGGDIVGSSTIPSSPDDGETTLEARIRYARDSLFDEELYHEMVRESRSLASLGISMKGTTISFLPFQCNISDATEVLFELVPLDDVYNYPARLQARGAMAQATGIVARLLLTQAHRERLQKRSEVPPPLSGRKDEAPVLPILRPVVSFLLHQSAQADANSYLDRVTGLLRAVDIDSTCEKASFKFAEADDLSDAGSLVTEFLHPWISNATLAITSKATALFDISIQLETTLVHNFGTAFILTTSERSFRFGSIDELREAADAAVLSGLAKSLARFAGGDWQCDEREALLTKKNEHIDAETAGVWVTLSGEAGTMSLNSADRKTSWSLQGESEQASIWDAFTKIVT